MRYIFLLLALLLTGCTTAPVKHKLPDLPKEISDKCAVLLPIPEDEKKLSELLKVVNQNYGLYYECVTKQESLVEWYIKQKKIHDDIHN